MKRFLQRLSLAALAMVLIVVVLPVIGVAVACGNWFQPPPPRPSAYTTQLKDLPGYARAEDQTYLTFPEWYVVYSADEYAAYVKSKPPSGFPYFRAITQYWEGYYRICADTREAGPFNWGYHVGLAVVGVSFTAESLVKGAYENTIGRLGETLGGTASPEDVFAADTAADYGTFIHTVPWYDYPYARRLSELLALNPQPAGLRRAERRFAVGTEYRIKDIYAGLIRGGTKAAYGEETGEVFAVVDGVTGSEKDLRVVRRLPDGRAVIGLVRYEAFTRNVPRLLAQGMRFVEIAGNDDILISVFAPRGWALGSRAGIQLFSLPVLTDPARDRVLIRAKVADLHTLLADLTREGAQLEHLYDY